MSFHSARMQKAKEKFVAELFIGGGVSYIETSDEDGSREYAKRTFPHVFSEESVSEDGSPCFRWTCPQCHEQNEQEYAGMDSINQCGHCLEFVFDTEDAA